MIPEIQLTKTLEVFLNAVKEGNLFLFETLFDSLAKQVDLSQILDETGQNMLHIAVSNGHLDLVKTIKEKYPELVQTKTKGAQALTPLDIAKAKGFKACITALEPSNHATASTSGLN